MKKLLILTTVYTIGLLDALIYLLMRVCGEVKLVFKQNRRRLQPRMMVIYNHPDLLNCMYEVFLVPALWCWQWLLHPIGRSPWFTMDGANFSKHNKKSVLGGIIGFLLAMRAIPLRRVRNGDPTGARNMFRVLEGGGIIIHPIEPGRTCTGKQFLVSKAGRKIRIPKASFGWLWKKTKAPIQLVWLENGQINQQLGKPLFSVPRFGRRPITVKFGILEFKPEFEEKTPAELTDIIAQNLLWLADRE